MGEFELRKGKEENARLSSQKLGRFLRQCVLGEQTSLAAESVCTHVGCEWWVCCVHVMWGVYRGYVWCVCMCVVYYAVYVCVCMCGMYLFGVRVVCVGGWEK